MDEFLDNISKRLGGLAGLAATYLGPTLAVVVLHFTGYLLYFGQNLAQLLDLGAITRFCFSAFIFLAACVAICRLIASLAYSTFRTKRLTNALNSCANLFTSLLPPIGWLQGIPLDLIVVKLIGLIFGAITFSVFYLSAWGAVLFIALSFATLSVLLVPVFIRAVLCGSSVTTEFKQFNFSGIIVLFLSVAALVAGNLRAHHVTITKKYHLYSNEEFDGCRPSDRTDDARTPVVIVLTSGRGHFVYYPEVGLSVFLPLENGYNVCIDSAVDVRAPFAEYLWN